MSDYFDYTSGRLTPGTTARASDVNSTFDKVSVGFDKLPTETDIKRGLINFVTAGGTADAITATLTYAPTAYVDGMQVVLKVTEANPGATTINVNNLGIKDVRRRDGSILQAGDLGAGNIVPMRYNATSDYFEIEGSMTAGVGSMATQNSTAVSITGGEISNVTMAGGTIATIIEDINTHVADTDAHEIDTIIEDHNDEPDPHSGILEPAFTKNTAFNKNFGTTSGTVTQGNDSRFLPAYGAVGSYVFAIIYGSGYGLAITPGQTFSGWSVRPTGISTYTDVGQNVTSVNIGWSDFAGTWRAHGYCAAGTTRYNGTLFQRIA